MAAVKSQRLKRALKAHKLELRITPPLYTWLSEQGDNSSLVDMKTGLMLMKLAKKRKYDARHHAFHSSALTGCQRAQVFGYLGLPPKSRKLQPEQINMFNDGTWRHMRWQVTLLMAGIVTGIEVPVATPARRFAGSIDAVNDIERWMLELKGTSMFAQVRQYGALPHHIRQVHGYLFARDDLEDAVIVYEDKQTNAWHEIIVPRDPKIMKQIGNILDELNEAVDTETLPDILDECQYGEGAYLQCPYAYACKQVQYPEAQAAAQRCSTSEQTVTFLKLKPRNSHRRRPPDDGDSSAFGSNGSGITKTVATPTGAIRVHRHASWS